MEYSLRRYEASQRLMWFVFFLFCLAIAYPFAKAFHFAQGAPLVMKTFDPEVLKSIAFWSQMYWIEIDPLGSIIWYLFVAAAVFVAGKFAWLLVQLAGTQVIKKILADTLGNSPSRPKPALENLAGAANSRRLFPAERLFKKIDPLPLRMLFHPFQRLRIMLTYPQGVLSSEEAAEKERRLVEIDWQVFWSAWSPFRWMLWLLPLLALLQTGWLCYLQVEPVFSGQLELDDLVGPLVAGLIPVAQSIVAVIGLSLASGLLQRMENFYLAGVDALFYERFLSRVPFQSSDTVILLEAMERHFRELHVMLKRLGTATRNEKDSGPEKQ